MYMYMYIHVYSYMYRVCAQFVHCINIHKINANIAYNHRHSVQFTV